MPTMIPMTITSTLVVATSLVASSSSQTTGPGSGPWEVARPEDEGLSAWDLTLAEGEINALVGERNCYIVVKNGKIVKEVYRRGRTVSSVSELYSHTKSMCSSAFGIAVGQRWADPMAKIKDGLRDTRQCNPEAIFQNVLTMTGQSQDLENPTFLYDASGRDCLNTLEDFIGQQNPDGLSAPAWKDEHWAKPIGIEHTKWGRGQDLPCGAGCQASCRDAARVGQLWVNNGFWDGHGQLIPADYAEKARTWIYPYAQDAWGEYGYTLWLWVTDDVDPRTSMMSGAHGQCTWMSREHNTVITSFGYDDNEDIGFACNAVWTLSKYAIVSKDHPKANMTRNATRDALFTNRTLHAGTERAKQQRMVYKEELPAMRDFVVKNRDLFSNEDYAKISKSFVREGLRSLFD
jgi:CubicO group peptidase (beta-lactamase class C family)